MVEKIIINFFPAGAKSPATEIEFPADNDGWRKFVHHLDEMNVAYVRKPIFKE